MPIIVRKPYSPPQSPKVYDGQWLRTQLALLAQAIAPALTRTVKGNTTLAATDDTILCDTSGGDITVTLLPASQAQFLKVSVKNIGTGVVTLSGMIDGMGDPTLSTQYATYTFQSDGIAWYLLSML